MYFISLDQENHKCSQIHTISETCHPMHDPFQWIWFIFFNERYKWENHVGNHIKLQFCLIAVYVQILVLLPSWNCILWSLVNSVSTAILIWFACQMNQERPPPLIYQSIIVTAIEWIDTHLHSQCPRVLCLTIMQRCLMKDSQYTVIRAPLYCEKVFYEHEERHKKNKDFLKFMWWTSWQDWKMVYVDEKMKAAIVL